MFGSVPVPVFGSVPPAPDPSSFDVDGGGGGGGSPTCDGSPGAPAAGSGATVSGDPTCDGSSVAAGDSNTFFVSPITGGDTAPAPGSAPGSS